MNLRRRYVLQLNASYEAIRIINARRAMTLLTKGKAVVELPTDKVICSGVYLPSVIRLVEYKKIPIRMQIVNRKNILMRDRHQCQYCGNKFPGNELELEHIIPRAQGGRSTWENLVAACRKCNGTKADRTPEEAGMPLLRRPLPLTVHTNRYILREVGSEVQEWNRYLFHDSTGDERFVAR